MTGPTRLRAWFFVAMAAVACGPAWGAELIPSLAELKTDRPRVLLRPKDTPHAVSLEQLRRIRRDGEFRQMLAQLEDNDHAAAQAMVWLLTGEASAAEKAIRRMREYRYPGRVDTFHIYAKLTELGLAYDWLYDYEGFTPQIRAEVRGKVVPLAQEGFRVTNDHMFHNYIWMSAGGTALWALATAGEDEQADWLFGQIRRRFNDGLYPAWRYLDGLPSEPMGYWSLYVLTPGVLALLGAQSAGETDLVGAVAREDGGWLNRHFENLIHSTLPDMRYVPWGDLQSGPNGGVTHEMAGTIDALAWALRSPHGAYFSRWLADRRGLRRFYGETAIFYMLYTRHLDTPPQVPPPGFFAGASHSGHFTARSGWDDGATVVALTCADHFGDHHHYDQGSFVIYRNGLLAVDPPVYRRIRGPQQKTENHNTLLLGGQPQRPVRGQWFKTVEQFQENLAGGRKLETGDILFHTDEGTWAAAAGQFAQAYSPELAQSCVRQLLFIRPDNVVVVDHLAAPEGKSLPEVEWLLHFPSEPTLDEAGLWASNGTSWIRCRAVLPGSTRPAVTASDVRTHRASYRYRGQKSLLLIHVLEVGDGTPPREATPIDVGRTDGAVEVTLDGRTFAFADGPPFEIRAR